MWEAHKAYIRGILIAIGAAKKKESRRKGEVLYKEIYDLEQSFKNTGDQGTELEIIIKKEELKDLIEQENRALFYRLKKERYQWGDMSSKYLSKILKRKKRANYFESIQTSNGEKVHATSDIARVFQEYYGKLYSITQKEPPDRVKKRLDNTRALLNEIGLKRIAPDKLSLLEDPITEEEILKILKESPAGKSPGPDGLSVVYYKKFSDSLVPRLCSYMNKIGGNREIRREALEAMITIIPKEGKDPLLCSSYRSIPLLNSDVKLFAKILASRMKTVMNDLVHTDQVGFIPGRESRDNGIRTFLLVQKLRE